MLALGMIAPVLPRLIASFMAGNVAGSARMLGIFGTVFAVMQFFFSPDRSARCRTVRPPSCRPALQLRPRPRLPADGLGARARLALPRPHHFRPHRLQRPHRHGLHDRRHPAGKARRRLRPGRRGLRRGLRARPRAGRHPRQRQPAPALLGRRRPQACSTASTASSSCPNRSPQNIAAPSPGSNANPLGSLRLLRNNKVLLGLASVLVLGYLAQQSLMNVYVLTADYRFGWSDRAVGLSLALVAIFSGFYGAGMVKPLVKRIGERSALTFGLIGGAIGYIMFGLSNTGMLCSGASPCSTSCRSPGPPPKPSCPARAAPPSGPDAGRRAKPARTRRNLRPRHVHLHLQCLDQHRNPHPRNPVLHRSRTAPHRTRTRPVRRARASDRRRFRLYAASPRTPKQISNASWASRQSQILPRNRDILIVTAESDIIPPSL